MNSRNNPPSDGIGIDHLGFSDYDIIIMNIKNVSSWLQSHRTSTVCNCSSGRPPKVLRVKLLKSLTVLKRVDFSFQPLLRRIHGGRTQSFVGRFRFSTVRCDRTQTHPSRLPIALSETGELYSPIILFLFA